MTKTWTKIEDYVDIAVLTSSRKHQPPREDPFVNCVNDCVRPFCMLNGGNCAFGCPFDEK
jgi:hypothetical protein